MAQSNFIFTKLVGCYITGFGFEVSFPGKKWILKDILQLEPDMHRPNVQIVLFWRATRCGFAKNCSKTPKITLKQSRFGDFCEKPHLVVPKSTTSGSHTNRNQRTRSNRLWRQQKWLFTKIAKFSLFDSYIFGILEQFQAKPHLVALQNRTI